MPIDSTIQDLLCTFRESNALGLFRESERNEGTWHVVGRAVSVYARPLVDDIRGTLRTSREYSGMGYLNLGQRDITLQLELPILEDLTRPSKTPNFPPESMPDNYFLSG